MQAHVFITDDKTHRVVTENGFWGTKIDFSPKSYQHLVEESLKQPQKKYFSMIADIVGTRPDDLVFLYERQVGFHGIYKIIGTPFFDTTPFSSIDGHYPIRIAIECLGFFPKPVPEDYLFSTKEYESQFWGWFYRKIQGGRGISTINPEATKALIELLVKVNGNTVMKPSHFNVYSSKALRFKINLPLGDERVDLEDILRAWVVQNLGNSSKKDLIDIFGPAEDLEWFANNVPYHVTKKNIDILVYHKNMKYTGFPLRYRYSVVELKRDTAEPKDVLQVVNYARWVASRLANSEVEAVQPILIAYDFKKQTLDKVKNSDFSDRGIGLFKYRVHNNDIEFDKVGK